MKDNKIYLGETRIKDHAGEVEGSFITINNERFYRIANYDRMPDFFMTLVSDSNHWLYISSNGSLSAGRKNRDNALFPYYTEDKIHDYCGLTGSKTICLVKKEEKFFLWKPFSKNLRGVYQLQRNICKSVYGNKIIFEEVNQDLGISFAYSWSFSDRFGFVKESTIANISGADVEVSLLDGIRNILPSGIDYVFQNEFSNLLDAYKKSELIEQTGLGLFMLSSIPVDRAEPSESLTATTVWSRGLSKSKKIISDHQLSRFTDGLPLETETDIRASRGAYYVNDDFILSQNEKLSWMIVAEINQNSTAVANLNHLLINSNDLIKQVKEDVESGTKNLVKIVAKADGLQVSNEELCTARHFSNTLYNIMRGGIFLHNYTLNTADFPLFIQSRNSKLSNKLQNFLRRLPEEISAGELLKNAKQTGNVDLIRITYEYLPLTFSRRHGDPSRPWNLFSIENKNPDGSPKLDYQGNWRDIFQNWEALSLSFPGYIEHIISKFLNASTPDGYNPYRIMRDGIDWESPDPDDPWAYIGYWGDHQIIYLQKLLEISEKVYPGKLDELLTKEIFVYANVPYRIKAYQDIVRNPKDTIDFDHELNNKINTLVDDLGADGKVLMDENSEIHYANLTEKIVVTLLAKLSNFIPEAGIWLNTQRPEWNDANNALVGNGASMVTLYYLRRFIGFWNDRFKETSLQSVMVAEEVKELFDKIYNHFVDNAEILDVGFSDKERRHFANVLGMAGSDYREKIYSGSFSGIKNELTIEKLRSFTQIAQSYIDHSIRVNKRKDGLYHAYNLISFKDDEVHIRYLYEMLEGQVAVLSSGYLKPLESLDLLDSLKNSALFRKDQYSYLLYPDRILPRFIDKNNIPAQKVSQSKLLEQLIDDGNNSIITADNTGKFHLDGSFRNAGILSTALDNLDQDKYGILVKKEKEFILSIYEEIFDHQSFTGRSGTFYGYEGLGSIYWHMVSKLLLATQECFFTAVEAGADSEIIGRLKDHYYEIKAGIGLYKSPELYGAFPTDAYSHTPGNAGAKQPGMTGQVKEDIISRLGELGLQLNNGEITLIPRLVNHKEILTKEHDFTYISVENENSTISLMPGQWAFTFCQVPFVCTTAETDKMIVHMKNQETIIVTGRKLSKEISLEIFGRTGKIEKVEIMMQL